CHGVGATGWVGPSLVDGRWRYGGSDGEGFHSIYFGRPRGMPAFGGLLPPDAIWRLVTYLRSQPAPYDVPTESWKGRNGTRAGGDHRSSIADSTSPLTASVAENSSALADALRDRYRIERELGRGGMATVYLAHDLKHDRLIALKVVRPELGPLAG